MPTSLVKVVHPKAHSELHGPAHRRLGAIGSPRSGIETADRWGLPPSIEVLNGESLLWMLLLGNAAALGALLFTLWQLQRLQRAIDVCASAATITVGRTSMSLGLYLVQRFNIRMDHGLSREAAATLRTHLASLSIEGNVADGSRGHRPPAAREPTTPQTTSPTSALDEFPEEHCGTCDGVLIER